MKDHTQEHQQGVVLFVMLDVNLCLDPLHLSQQDYTAVFEYLVILKRENGILMEFVADYPADDLFKIVHDLLDSHVDLDFLEERSFLPDALHNFDFFEDGFSFVE